MAARKPAAVGLSDPSVTAGRRAVWVNLVSDRLPCPLNSFSRYYLKLLTLAVASIIIVESQTNVPVPATEQTTILWSLAPCQSAFWIPSTSSEFNQNWITYQYEGNPISQFDTNLAVISTTIHYGSFQLRARAVPKNYGFPPKVSSTTPTSPAIESTPTVTISPSSSTSSTSVTTDKPPSVTSQDSTSSTSLLNTVPEIISQSTSSNTTSTRSTGLPRVIVKMVPELYRMQ
ncbi:hypothetical protein V9T40_014400 [Parthenolecanium corni]|uniref:Uncharacterized protein n=1 Tax=Parthenolecanium corni TaxID=536013 RepID=A0AAN9TGB0_9HEMI